MVPYPHLDAIAPLVLLISRPQLRMHVIRGTILDQRGIRTPENNILQIQCKKNPSYLTEHTFQTLILYLHLE